jgi:hypothetical protein
MVAVTMSSPPLSRAVAARARFFVQRGTGNEGRQGKFSVRLLLPVGCQSTSGSVPGVVTAAAADSSSKAGLSTALRNIGWVSFWSQFTLSVVSGIVLLFSTGLLAGNALQPSPTDVLTATGVLTGLVAAFISWGLVRTGRLIAEGKVVKLELVMAAVLASTRLNLIGLGATILGMQASIGGLVAKTLSSAAGGMAYYNARVAPPPVAFDVFTVQSGINSVLAHYLGLVLAFWLLNILRRHIAKEEEGA